MSFSNVDLEEAVVIRKLPNQPSNQGMNAEQLKESFDGGAENLVAALNRLIDALNNPTAAENLGFNRTAGVPEANVQAAIENVQSQLQGISQGAVADGSITTDKLDDDAVTTIKIVDSAVTADKLAVGAVTTGKILGGAVTTDKLADHSVTPGKLAGVETGWRKLSPSELGLDGNTDTILYFDAYYHEFLGIVRFIAKIDAGLSSGVVFYSFTGSHLPLIDEDAADVDSSWVPAYGIVNAGNGSFSGRETYYAKIGYSGTSWGHVLHITGPAERHNIYVSGFYCVGVVTSEEEGS